MYVLNAPFHCVYYIGPDDEFFSVEYYVVHSILISRKFLIIIIGTSPVEVTELTSGEHSLKIVPQDCGKNRRPQNVKFTV